MSDAQRGLWQGLRLPAGRFPGLDADGRGTWDVNEAVAHGARGQLWDPYEGFEPCEKLANANECSGQKGILT